VKPDILPLPTGDPASPPGRCLILAEVAQAHDGSLATAHAYIDAVADAGADGVKFQTHLASAESTPREGWRRRFPTQDATRYDYWRRMEFQPADWQGLADHARARGLLFLSSPFSVEAVDLLEEVGVAAWKLASGEVGNGPLCERLAASSLPWLISTGMSPWAEIDAAVTRARGRRLSPGPDQHGLSSGPDQHGLSSGPDQHGLSSGPDQQIPFAVLQCTSRYPTPHHQIGLNVLAELRHRYGCPVGLSDHSGQPFAGLAAATLGAAVVEVHVAFSRQVFSPDLEASLTIDELAWLCRGVQAIAEMREPVDKDAMALELRGMRQLFTKSLVASRPLAAGMLLAASDLVLKKPGDGLGADALPLLIGRRLRRALAADEPIGVDDVTTDPAGAGDPATDPATDLAAITDTLPTGRG
jgi:N,N'-diacetyllegionaminate synthase